MRVASITKGETTMTEKRTSSGRPEFDGVGTSLLGERCEVEITM
jgi:hypothetical protein